MNLAQLNRILRQALLLPVIALLLTATALYLQMRSANDTVGIIQMTDARIAQTALVARLIVDEESALRGYENTGDERFLQPFNDAGKRLPSEFEKLDQLTRDDPQQQFSLNDLRNEHQTWRDAFALPIVALVRAGGHTSDVNLNLYGKSLMDQLRRDIDEITQHAGTRRTERIEQWQQQVRHLLAIMIAVALGMGILIGLFMRNRLHAVSSAYRSSLEILGRRAQEIFESEQKLRTTLDSIAEGVITCDIGGIVQMINPVAAEMTGWRAADAIGQPLQEIYRVVEEQSHAPLEDPVTLVRRLNASASPSAQTALIRKDGSELLIAANAAPVRDQNGETAGVVLVFRDITMERRTQEALISSEKLAVAGRLAATIAHEIHNPLDSVSNLLYLMKNGVSEEESRQFIDMAEQELARVTHISRAMLGLYRESRSPVRVNVREILQDVLVLMDHRFQELGIRMRVELPEDLFVDAFPAELRQVFTNLLTNAAEASPRGGEVIVTAAAVAASMLEGKKTPAGVRIAILDNGEGVSDEIRPNLFQPFFTTKGEQGTGLGLWVSRGIIHKHGGTIELNSRGNGQHGTEVRVFLAEKLTVSA